MTKNNDAGFAAIQFLFLLLFLSALAAGTAMVISGAMKVEDRSRSENAAIREMNRILEEIVACLYADPDPWVNGPGDPVMDWRDRREGDYAVKIGFPSNRLNPNFIRPDVFENTNLFLLLNPGKTAGGLRQFREDRGFSLSPDFYADFISPGVFEKYFSCYGWANINLIDEFAARRLVLAMTGSEQEAGAFHEKIRTLLMNRRLVAPSELRQVLGDAYRKTFPLINAESLLNINDVEPLLLRELIAYPGYGIDSPESKYQEILSRRSAGPLDAGDIQNILEIDAANPLYYYLGALTWFWEIDIAGKGRSCHAVVCRLPPQNPEHPEPPSYAIIERRYR